MGTTLQIKRIISLVLLLLVAISLFGCEPISKYEPYNYPNSLWVCEEPHMEIAVDTIGNLRPTIEINGEESCFAIGFRAMNAYAYKNLNDSTTLFWGHCKFSEDEFTIILQDGKLWDDGYARLVFKRVE